MRLNLAVAEQELSLRVPAAAEAPDASAVSAVMQRLQDKLGRSR